MFLRIKILYNSKEYMINQNTNFLFRFHYIFLFDTITFSTYFLPIQLYSLHASYWYYYILYIFLTVGITQCCQCSNITSLEIITFFIFFKLTHLHNITLLPVKITNFQIIKFFTYCLLIQLHDNTSEDYSEEKHYITG